MYQENGKSLLILGLLLGAALGAAAGLLLAPKTGNETREILRQGIASGTERIRELRRGLDAETEETRAD